MHCSREPILLLITTICILVACSTQDKPEESSSETSVQDISDIKPAIISSNVHSPNLLNQDKKIKDDSLNKAIQDSLTWPKTPSSASKIAHIDSCLLLYKAPQKPKAFINHHTDIKIDSFQDVGVHYVECSEEIWSDSIRSFSLDYYEENLIGFHKFWLINNVLCRIETFKLKEQVTENGLRIKAQLEQQYYYENGPILARPTNLVEHKQANQLYDRWNTLKAPTNED